MSQSVTVIGGTNQNNLTGLVSVSVAGASGSQISQIQTILDGLSSSVEGGSVGFLNDNLVGTGQTSGIITIGASSVGSGLLELSNTDSTGGMTAGIVSVTATIPSSYTTIIAQAPGAMNLTGPSNGGDLYVLGANTTVQLNTGSGTNTIYGSGGSDTINPGSGSTSINYTAGNSSVQVQSGSNTITATGNASVYVHNESGFSGTVNFINNSTAKASVFGGAGSNTIFGGAAGGTFFGGTSGNNSMIGGAGSVYMAGRSSNDILEAGVSTGGATVSGANYLYAGAGNETLFASSVTGTNLFAAGSGADSIISEGSGTQYMFGNVGSASITGSSMSGAANVYFFGGAATSTGGNDLITNFNTNRDVLYALGSANIETITGTSFKGQTGALVTLTDGTHITMLGVNAAGISSNVGGKSIA